MLNHLRYRSARCRDIILASPPLLSQSEADALDTNECGENVRKYRTGLRRHSAGQEMSYRISGPICRAYFEYRRQPSVD